MTTNNTHQSDVSIEVLFKHGLALHQAGDITGAKQQYLKTIELQPDHADTLQLLGTAYYQLGNLQEAKTRLSQALKIAPDMAATHCNLGNVLSSLGELNAAITTYQKALELDPTLTQAHTSLGNIYRNQGIIQEAEQAYLNAIATFPNYIEANFNLALLYKNQQRMTEAEPLFHTAIETVKNSLAEQPENIAILDQLGNIYGDSGQLPAAVKCFEKIITLLKNSSPVESIVYQQKLGLALFRLEDFDQALNCYQQILKINPDYSNAHHYLALIYQQKEKYELAQQYFKSAIKLEPDNPGYHYNFAKLNDQLGLLNETLSAYKKAIELNPDLIDSHLSLAQFFQRNYDYKNEKLALLKASELFPNNLNIMFHLGTCYVNWSKPDQALHWFEKIVEIDPQHQGANGSIAAVFILQGKYQKAHDILQPLIRLPQPEFSVVTAFADIAHRFNEEQAAIELLNNTLNNPGLSGRAPAILHFTLGKLYDRTKSYPSAFRHFQKANQLDQPKFDRKELTLQFNSRINFHSLEKHIHYARSISVDERPVFIIGMERSGTSLVEQILASHPDVYGAGELPAIPQIIYDIQKLKHELYPQCLSALDEELLNTKSAQYLNIATEFCTDETRITDKLPGNFVNIGLIELLFPKARIIHCKRNPVDTCLSIYFQQFAGFIPYAYDLNDLGFYYRQYEKLMAHWKNVSSLPIFDIQYEDFVENTEVKSRELVNFIELEWSDQCLDFYNAKRTVATNSSDQVRNPIYKSSVARWKNYEQFLTPLLEALEYDYAKN